MKNEVEIMMQDRVHSGLDPEPEEKPVCLEYPQCINCPYPNHGFVCWGKGENCIRTEVERMNAEKENYATICK